MAAGIVGARPPKGFDYELPIKIHKTRLCCISRYFYEYLPDRQVSAHIDKFQPPGSRSDAFEYLHRDTRYDNSYQRV